MSTDEPAATSDDEKSAFETELEQEVSDAISGDGGKRRAAFLATMDGAQESIRRRRRILDFSSLALGLIGAILSAATSLVSDADALTVDWSAVFKGVGVAVGGAALGLVLALVTTTTTRRRQVRAKLQSSQLRTLDRQARILETYIETQQWFLSSALTRQSGAST